MPELLMDATQSTPYNIESMDLKYVHIVILNEMSPIKKLDEHADMLEKCNFLTSFCIL